MEKDARATRMAPPRPAPSLDLPAGEMRALTEACARFAIEHVASLGRQPSWDLDGAAAVAAAMVEPPPAAGVPIGAILDRLAAAVPKSFNTAGPGYLAYIPGGGLYPSALGDFLALAINRYVGIWASAPALVQIETTVIDWLREMVGYPAGSRGILTTGGSISNLTAVVTARRALLPDDFLGGTLYTSDQAHHSVAKAAALAGFPDARLALLPTDERFRLRPEALEEAVRADAARGLRPFLVVASAGTTNTGAVDPLPEIAAICRRHGLWLHVDAAYGGFFRMTPGGERLIPGLELADSVALDPHKGLFLPYGTGCLLVRDPEALRRAHQMRADYFQGLEHPEEGVSFADLSPELSRECRGLRLWLPLKLFGVDAFRDNLREKLELARWAWAELRGEPGIECVDEPQLSIVAFRARGGAGPEADAAGEALLNRINARRRVYISATRLRGRYTLRFCVLSHRTHAAEMAMALEDLRAALRGPA